MPRKLLIVDDLAINRRILKGMLCKEYDILEAAGGAEALETLIGGGETVSAVLLDISMPGMDGYEVLKKIRSNASLSRLPVIMITGSDDEETRIKSLTLGANDFVMKPYSNEIIKHCLKNNIALQEASEAVDILQRDRLTGLWNRETFFKKAAALIAEKPEGYYVLGCVDIDNFKVINDQYGSDMGDEVLKGLADALRESSDIHGGICARVFADCFVGLYPLSLTRLESIGPGVIEKRIREATGLELTLGVGRYIVKDKSLTVSAMYDRAVIAQRTVKGRYDKHVAVYDESMRSHIVREQEIVNDMKPALAKNQFEVWFQPQYNHSANAMIGAEALVRWRHPQKGLIAPNEFIPVFEKNGFIYSLDKYVWEKVCACLRKWIDEGRRPLPISVNVSRYDVLRPDVVEYLSGLIESYGIPIDLLRLEITESAFAGSSEHIVDVVKKFVNRGFTVEIDDFGSGYSSLNTLKDVPAQIIKLDMRFLESSFDSQRGGNIVESVVRMAKWLGVSVIAEGVETIEQANYLRSIGCNYIQGYLYAKPMRQKNYEEHCSGINKEERLLTLETVENLDNNSFWDPNSMDTLIFNSFIGAACIYEYHRGNIELLRATDKYAQVVLGDGATIEDALKIDWKEHLTSEGVRRVRDALEESVCARKEVTGEYAFLDLPGCPRETHLRSSMRVIATAGDRYLVYCTNDNITAQRELIERLRISEEENSLAVRLSGNIICRYTVADKTLTLSNDVASSCGLPAKISGVPYDPVSRGMISEESAKAYVTFFESILSGKRTAEATFQQRYSGEWRWLEAKSATVFSSDGEPIKAVISFYDITERREKEAIYKKWQQSLEDRMTQSYTMYRCNLNNDASYAVAEGTLLTFDFDSAGRDFNERAKAYIKQRVSPDDREAYASLVNSDAMLAGYYRGKRSDTLEYREITPEGKARWLKLTIELVERPNSRDVDAYLLYEDIDETKKGELQTRQLAQTDSLTGLLNRKTFVEKFERLIARRKDDSLSALFIIDLDGFKQVNDSFGHAIGDETLIEMGQKLRGTFRSEDLVCRLGGDEFMVYMCDVSQMSAVNERASLVCSLLHKSFSLEVQLSASVGIAVCPEDGTGFETLYRKADLALYHVKETGKDSYALYANSMFDKTVTRRDEVSPEPPRDDGATYAAPKHRMLIVEDNELNRDFLTHLFKDEFIIDTASEGTAALIKLRRYGSGISVVLLDLMMPGLDGFAVLKKMRESVVMQSIPVIVVSGMNERETCLDAIKSGAADYITKPVDADLLKLRVASAITKAENERLRARNRYLAIQNDEAKRLAEAKRNSDELTVALHAAERADLAKSQFLSSMSHEIRTPLNAVIGYNTIARGELSTAQTDEERRQADMRVMDCLTKSEVASRHLLTIINDVLDMSAIESGKMKVDESPFDFRSLITSLTVMFFSQARSKGVNFEVLFDKPTEEWFVGDQMRINQILTNLLSNAVKFTPEGGNVTLAITESRVDDKSTGFRFVVSDTGIGMTQEYIKHIWTPFEQAEASISRRFGGTGLGLSITKNLVDLMKGEIQVESESGVGSKFIVSLTFTRMEQPKKSSSYDFSDVNALVADDDASTCDYIKLLFDRCGANCLAVTSGKLAVDAFAKAKESGRPFNVCLIDWRMPDMDGFETISRIRRIADKDLPIVVVTAYDFLEVSDQAEKIGINRFISKPLFQSSLYDLLANISAKQSSLTIEKSPTYDFDGARVLLVEDNNMNMEVARRILLSAKIAVDSAWNGQEAVDIFEASRKGAYKAILMDVHMPQVDGYQATRMIRASSHPDARRIPIIAMTADVFAEDIAQAHSAGMNDHIAKPIELDALFKMLSKYMEGNEE